MDTSNISPYTIQPKLQQTEKDEESSTKKKPNCIGWSTTNESFNLIWPSYLMDIKIVGKSIFFLPFYAICLFCNVCISIFDIIIHTLIVRGKRKLTHKENFYHRRKKLYQRRKKVSPQKKKFPTEEKIFRRRKKVFSCRRIYFLIRELMICIIWNCLSKNKKNFNCVLKVY